MAARVINTLADPLLVVRFQKLCGVHLDTSDPSFSTYWENKELSPCPEASRIREDVVKTVLSDSSHNLSYTKTYHVNGTTTIHSNGYHKIDQVKCTDGHCSFDSRNGYPVVEKLRNGYHTNSIDKHSKIQAPPRVVVRYRVLYWWARLGALLGNETFYLTAFPFMTWCVDATVMRQTCFLWFLVMYLGQATKDYLRWPRPRCPPVIRLETQYSQEFSMPSTHAMSGTVVPLFLSKLILDRYQTPSLPVILVAIFWCTSTCLSRLYLGVHTVLDVVCGIFYALGIYASFSPVMAHYDHYQQTHSLSPVVLLATSLALSTVCYPSSHKDSARKDAVQITAVLAGVGIGAWLNFQLGLSSEIHFPTPMPVHLPSLYCCWLSVLQFTVGIVVVFVSKVLIQFLSVHFFIAYYGLEHVDKQHPSVMVACKYTTYLSLGIIIAFLIPLLFTILGIDRPTYYQEVF